MEPPPKWTWKRIVGLGVVAALLVVIARNMYADFVNRPDSGPMYLLVLGLGSAYVVLSVLPATRAYLRKHAKRNFVFGCIVIALAFAWLAAFISGAIAISVYWGIYVFAAGLLIGGLMMGEWLLGESSRELARALGKLLR